MRINTGYQPVEDIHWAMSIAIRSASYWEQVSTIPILSFKRKKATEYYVSTGLNFGLRNNNVLSLGLKYKGRMKIPNGMQKENSFSLFLNITFSERTYRAKIQ